MHSICVGNMIKLRKPLQMRNERTYIYDRYYIRTHVYVFLFCVQKRVFEFSRAWPWRWPPGGTPYVVFIGPESRTLWLWISGKRNVPVCRGHGLANALYWCSVEIWTHQVSPKILYFLKILHNYGKLLEIFFRVKIYFATGNWINELACRMSIKHALVTQVSRPWTALNNLPELFLELRNGIKNEGTQSCHKVRDI